MTCYPKVDALIFRESASPPDFEAGPPIVPGVEAGQVAFYYKADGKWYVRAHQGTEQEWGGGGAAGGAWVNATFLNGWTNYNMDYFGPLQYRKVGDRVDIRGLVRGGVPMDSAIFQLPADCRPPNRIYQVVSSGNFGGLLLVVFPDGYVKTVVDTGAWRGLFFSFIV
jgi:hypothetical protein